MQRNLKFIPVDIMKVHSGIESIVPLNLNLGTSCLRAEPRQAQL